MDFEQFAAIIRNLVNDGLAPAQIRAAAHDIIGAGADAALALAAERDQVVREALAGTTPAVLEGEVIPPKAETKRNGSAASVAVGAGAASRPEVKRARALVREQLRDGPRPGAEVEAAAQAAAIPKAALLAATDALGVRVRRGEWRLPV
jgi:hypothetical protein